jgi:hypothetical protein
MFDPTVTTDMHSFITQLGDVRLRDLIGSSNPGYRYGYIGTEDRMMYPLIMPGAIVEIDEQRKEITRRLWRREFERPIYFLETSAGFACCWCAIEDGNIILQPHPISPEPVRFLPLSQLKNVVGQVVAVAMRLEVFADTDGNP